MAEEKTNNEKKEEMPAGAGKQENLAEEKKPEDKPVKKKQDEKKIVKKEEAVARTKGAHISMKHAKYICRFIKWKHIEKAISDLEQVSEKKKVVPFKGEIPHRKGKGMMSGRYPVKASKVFIKALKGLKGNVIINGMDLDKSVVCEASASWAYRPAKTGGREAKRTNIIIKAKEMNREKNG